MNPNETRELMETISLVRKEYGVTILLIEHDMKLVQGICEYLYVLNFGRLLTEGEPKDVLNNPEVITPIWEIKTELAAKREKIFMAMLTVEKLNVYYGMIHALKDVSFHVNEGEIVALIGANGAGKDHPLCRPSAACSRQNPAPSTLKIRISPERLPTASCSLGSPRAGGTAHVRQPDRL